MKLGTFSIRVLQSLAPSLSPNQAAEEAAQRYLADRTLRPPGWVCLPFPEDSSDASQTENAVEIELSNAISEELAVEARAQGVSIDALVSHAVMYAWAAERGHVLLASASLHPRPSAPVPQRSRSRSRRPASLTRRARRS